MFGKILLVASCLTLGFVLAFGVIERNTSILYKESRMLTPLK